MPSREFAWRYLRTPAGVLRKSRPLDAVNVVLWVLLELGMPVAANGNGRMGLGFAILVAFEDEIPG